MKRIIALTCLVALACTALLGCQLIEDNIDTDPTDRVGISNNDGSTHRPNDGFYMKARVTALYSDYIEVEVVESEVAYGRYWVRTADSTRYLTAEGDAAAKGDIKVGDLLTICYSGQIMMSLPPQIVAHGIVIE